MAKGFVMLHHSWFIFSALPNGYRLLQQGIQEIKSHTRHICTIMHIDSFIDPIRTQVFPSCGRVIPA